MPNLKQQGQPPSPKQPEGGSVSAMSAQHSAEQALIAKYDRPGPRYTSYPTAPLFSEETGAEALRAELETGEAGPLSLYVHLPFCYKLCWYCGCNMKVERNSDRRFEHLALVHEEIDRVAPNTGREIHQVHFGGGSPNYLEPGQLVELTDHLRDRFKFADDAELSLEADPRVLSEEHLDAMHLAGFNRVSLGVQDFDDQVQKAVNRIQPFDLIRERMEGIRSRGIQSVNMDLMYGLPFQNPTQFQKTVARAVALDPDRIALFNFAYLPKFKPHMALIKQENLPTPQEKWQMLLETVATLEDSGYVFIGMDHFAKPDDPLAQALANGSLHRNFQGYSTRSGLDMLAFGMSAISMFDGLYTQNYRSIPEYEEAIKSGSWATWRGFHLSEDDRMRRGIINELMCRYTIDTRAIEAQTGEDFDTYFPNAREQLNAMVEDDLLTQTERIYRVTHKGRLLMRNIAMVFDKYLPAMVSNGKTQFSRTV